MSICSEEIVASTAFRSNSSTIVEEGLLGRSTTLCRLCSAVRTGREFATGSATAVPTGRLTHMGRTVPYTNGTDSSIHGVHIVSVI